MRLFIATPVSPELRERLAIACQRWRARPRAWPVKWVAPENLHLTFRFLGETPANAVDAIVGRLQEACAGLPAVEVKVAGLGCFPSFARPRVVWVGLEETPPGQSRLAALPQAVDQATAGCGEAVALGSEQPKAVWQPHLTVGRVKTLPARESRRLGEELQRWDPGPLGEWRIDRVVLMQSVLARSGPVYEELASVALRADL